MKGVAVYFLRRITSGMEVGRDRDDFATGNRICNLESFNKAIKDHHKYAPGDEIGMGKGASSSGQVSFFFNLERYDCSTSRGI